jgi:hypothetical protein
VIGLGERWWEMLDERRVTCRGTESNGNRRGGGGESRARVKRFGRKHTDAACVLTRSQEPESRRRVRVDPESERAREQETKSWPMGGSDGGRWREGGRGGTDRAVELEEDVGLVGRQLSESASAATSVLRWWRHVHNGPGVGAGVKYFCGYTHAEKSLQV